MSEETALAKPNGNAQLATRELTRADLAHIGEQFSLLHEFVKSHLREGIDYGVIPGTRKKVLLKPGAERILLLFRCSPKFSITTTEMGGEGDVEYVSHCEAVRMADGVSLAFGDGSANTKERKFYRQGGTGYDVRNNVLKMAKKRSEVDCALNLSGLSDAFTQDVDEGPSVADAGFIEGPDSPQVPSPPAADGVTHPPTSALVLKFGRDKDKMICEATDENLSWYLDTFRSAIEDPSKSRYKASNEKYLAAVEAELQARLKVGAP